MKYITSIAFVVGLAAAGGNCDRSFRLPVDVAQDVRPDGTHQYLNSIGSGFMAGANGVNGRFIEGGRLGEIARLQETGGVGDQQDVRFRDGYAQPNEDLINPEASRSNANYYSRQCGVKYIPAQAEQTHREAAAQIVQDKDKRYALKGSVRNNYKLNGELQEREAIHSRGSESSFNILDLKGDATNRYEQSGKKEQECQGPLTEKLLDKSALEVSSNPAKSIDQKVNDAIKRAISKQIAEACKFALSSTIDEWIEV